MSMRCFCWNGLGELRIRKDLMNLQDCSGLEICYDIKNSIKLYNYDS